MSDQQLINQLDAHCANLRAARSRGDAQALRQNKNAVDATLAKLTARGHNALDCLAACGE